MAPADLDLLTAERDAVGPARPEMTSGTLHTVQKILAQFVGETDGTRPDTIDPRSRLTDFAANSVQLLQIHARLEDGFGIEISASALFDHDTVAALAAHLATLR